MVGTAGFEYTTKEKTYCKINDLEICIFPKITSNDPKTPVCGNTVVTGFGGMAWTIRTRGRPNYEPRIKHHRPLALL